MSSRNVIGLLTWDYQNPKGGMGRSMQWIVDSLKKEADVHVGSPSSEARDVVLPFTRTLGKHLLFSLLLPFVIRRWLKRHSVQTVVYPVGPGGIFPFLLPKKQRRVAVVYHTYAQQSMLVPGQWWKKIFVPLERSVLKNSDDVICFCSDTYEFLITYYKIPAACMHLLPHAIATNEWRGESIQKESGLCICVARLEARKGVEVLLRAWLQVAHTLPQARLVIIGDGVQRTRIDAMIASLKNVERRTALSFQELQSLVQRAEIAVCPAYLEGFGLAAAEAMAAGTAVIASDVDGLRSLITHTDTGILVESGNSSALAQAVIRLLQEKDVTQKIAVAGQVFISRACDPAVSARALQSVICTNHV